MNLKEIRTKFNKKCPATGDSKKCYEVELCHTFCPSCPETLGNIKFLLDKLDKIKEIASRGRVDEIGSKLAMILEEIEKD